MSGAIPLVDLKTNYRSIEAEVRAAVDRVLDSGQYILGPEVETFEREYAAFAGVKHCVGVANGTDAVELVVRAAGLTRHDEVLVPANSFVASALAVERAGAKVKLVDCTWDSLLDVEACEARHGPDVRAVMPVHLFGQCADLEAVAAYAHKHGLVVLEDAAQSQGASRNGRGAGSVGLGAGTSFYPGKNLGAYGDAGAVLTQDDAFARKVRALRNYGSEVKYSHPETGFNSRLDPVQAAVLRVKLKHLGRWNEQRRAAARRYDEFLAGLPEVTRPQTLEGNVHVFHLYVVRLPEAKRDRVLAAMQADGLGVAVHYPAPIHLQGAFKHLGFRAGDFPVAEALARQMVSLPLYPELTVEQQARVVASLKKALTAG
ncbi:MAG: DegT/DnrJ/EryC1/StrS family aminotransferase [Myxococcales bacterium]|nr:DegT/DnrJ/EryC1/StrS family aminotransferase [Myxococcales bacterium]